MKKKKEFPFKNSRRISKKEIEAARKSRGKELRWRLFRNAKDRGVLESSLQARLEYRKMPRPIKGGLW